MDYDVIPKGNKPLFELLLEKGSPGEQAFVEMGGRSWIREGITGFRLGDIFYTVDPDSLNTLNIIGMDAIPFFIEMPVTKVAPKQKGLVLHDSDSEATLYISSKSFHLDIGKIQMSGNGNGHRTPSPWK